MTALAIHVSNVAAASVPSGLSYVLDLLKRARVEVGWDWSNRAFGYCREFEELGMTALVIGPLHVQFDWDI